MNPPPQDHSIDQASRALALGLSRRQSLKLVIGGALAAATTDIEPAWANKECVCGGNPLQPGQACCQWEQLTPKIRRKRETAYDPEQQCCTRLAGPHDGHGIPRTGRMIKVPFVPEFPEYDITACPRRVQRVPPSDNCHCDIPEKLSGFVGGDEFPRGCCCDPGPADEKCRRRDHRGCAIKSCRGCANFKTVCIPHDRCYSNCAIRDVARCNKGFLAGLTSQCEVAFPLPTDRHQHKQRMACFTQAERMNRGVTNYEKEFFAKAQGEHCDCCKTKPCCRESPCCGKDRVMCRKLCCQRGYRCAPGGRCVPKAPPPVIPEVPTTVLLPLSGLAAIVAYLFRRRTRVSSGEAAGGADSDPGDSA
jgi:hypothetical protein